MKQLNKTEHAAMKQLHTRCPIQYWQAQDAYGCQIENNNSISILRHRYGNSVRYVAIR